jgi:hypothetical protein
VDARPHIPTPNPHPLPSPPHPSLPQERQYSFIDVCEWFAARCDLILLLFDPFKLVGGGICATVCDGATVCDAPCLRCCECVCVFCWCVCARRVGQTHSHTRARQG